MGARRCWIHLFVLILISVLSSPVWSHALLDEKVILAIEYHYPATRRLTLVLRNQLDYPITILSPQHPQFWLKHLQVLMPDGQPVTPTVDIQAPPPGEADKLQLPAKKTLRVLAAVPIIYNITPGQLYFLKFTIPTNRPTRTFSGVFPYGIPSAPFEPWDGGDPQRRLHLSMQCNDRYAPTFALIMENFTNSKAEVLPPDYVQLMLFRGADGKNLPTVSNCHPAPNIRNRFPLKPREWLHFHIDVEKCLGVKLLPERLYFLDFRYPTENNLGSFTGVFPYGIPAPITKERE